MLLQNRQRQIVARAHLEQMLARVARIGDDTGEVCTQRLDVWLESDARPALGPQELLRERRRSGTPALRKNDQGLTENPFTPA